MFKRRDRRPVWRLVAEVLWPRGGWARAVRYIKLRLNRLPDPPHRIARGIFAGVFTTFTPFYGVHFVIAGVMAWIMRGNVLAALLSTFFGNPLTYAPIIATSMYTGYWLLGLDPRLIRFHSHHPDDPPSIGDRFVEASVILWQNFKALFTKADADWQALMPFYNEVFYPFLVGGLIPGVVAGTIAYYLSLPLITAYQNRRKGVLQAKLAALKKSKAKTGGTK